MTARVAAVEAKEEYLLAKRQLGILPISMSIAAAWMWAPALLVAAQLGYLYGFWGVFFFSVPNIIAVLIFGPVAVKARQALPDGVTYSGYQRRAHSPRVLGLFVGQDVLATFSNMLANVIAGAFVLSFATGLPYALCAVVISAIPLLYTLPGGFRISTMTDLVTVTAILGVVVLGSILTIGTASVATLTAGSVGTLGMSGAAIAAGLGLTLTIHLLAAPYSDQTLWQRAWAARPQDVNKAFLLGGLLFAPVPILCGLMGMVAGGSGLVLDDPQRALFASVGQYLAPVFTTAFVIAIVLSVIDTLDSAMSATSAFISDPNTLGWSVRKGQIAMVAMTSVVVGVALTNVSIFSVQLLYGVLAGASLLPGLLTLLARRKPTERSVFWGIVLGFAIGVPIYLYGTFAGGGDMVVLASFVLTIGISGAIAFAFSRPR